MKQVKPPQDWQNALIKNIVWFSHDKFGNPFSHADILAEKNKKPIPIHDYFPTVRGTYYTDQMKCISKCKQWLEKNEWKIISCLVILRHRKWRKEYTIGKFIGGTGFAYFLDPQFRVMPDGTTWIKNFTYTSESCFSEDFKTQKLTA
jgi:hypothetical protein